MKIAVLGGGHGAHTMAADLALKGHEVNMYEMPRFERQITDLLSTREIVTNGGDIEGTARLNLVTTDIEKAIAGIDWIFIIVPSFAHRPYAELLAPHVKSSQKIVLFPGNLGSMEFVKVFEDEGIKGEPIIAETDTLPWACRRVDSSQVRVYHTLKGLGIGVYPSDATVKIARVIADLYPVSPHSNVLECSLNSLNPVLHIAAVLLNVGRIEYSKGEFYLYEEGYTPSVAKMVEAVDEERLKIAKSYGFNLPTLADSLYATGYGPKGDVWQAVNGSYLTPIKGPTNVQNRYLTEDTPCGLLTWSQLADVTNVDSPIIDSLITLVSKLTGHNYWTEGRTLERLGLANLDKEELLRKIKGK